MLHLNSSITAKISSSEGGRAMEVMFEKERETKRCIRYREVAEEGQEVIGTLYVKKRFAKDRDMITIDIPEAEGETTSTE